ncbi:MAG: RnfH family protein [Nitrosomonadaceae bacterium]|nr:RnfH family protein [Nitrosomonadaceae bacterium]
MIEIEVVYALPEDQVLEYLKIPNGTTVAQAIQSSNIYNKLSETQRHNMSLGIFGKLVKSETILHNHDRIEIYRPITIDPKEKRRKRIRKSILNKKY